jgi:toxin ParE1/3/4
LHIAEENPLAADESLDSIHSTVSLLAAQLEIGRIRPELADGLRSFPTRTPYIIFYVPDKDGILIIRVLHHARDINTEYFA